MKVKVLATLAMLAMLAHALGVFDIQVTLAYEDIGLSMYSTAKVGVVALAMLILFVVVTMTYNEYFHPLRNIPGPFLYRTTQIPWIRSWVSGHYHLSLLSLHEKYGEIVRVAPNQISFIGTTAFQQIYSSESINRDSRLPKLNANSADIILFGDLTDHARFRKYFANSVNAASALLSHKSVIHSNTDHFRTKLEVEVHEKKGLVNMTNLYELLTFDIVGDLIWRETFGGLSSMKSHSWQKLTQTTGIGAYAVLIAQFPLLYKFVMALTPCSIIEHAEDVVRVKNKTHLNSAPADSLLALATNRASAPMSTLEIEANLVILINAGSETLSGSLCATTYYLAQNKACAKKAREEVRAAFAKESDICQPLVTELPYLNAVIIEAFRLFPAVPNSIPREATANVMIDGIRKAESTSKLLCSISERINTFVFMLFGFGRDQQTLKCQLNVSKLCAQSR